VILCRISGKKSPVPGSDGYVPSIFPHNTTGQPRRTRTSTAAGYAPLPRTWHHIRHQLSKKAKRRLRRAAVRPGDSVGRPAKASHYSYCLPQCLKNCGHDYIQTAYDDKSVVEPDLLHALGSVDKLRNENDLLSSRILSISNVKLNDRLFQFYTNLPNLAVFDAIREYLQTRM